MTTLTNVTASLERAWASIRTVFPIVRPAVIVVYLHHKCDRRGHYLERGWTTIANGKLDEIHISSHVLAEGAESVLETLLHEAVHSGNVALGVQDCSRQGRYHNKAFADLAGDMGLRVFVAPPYGYAVTQLTDDIRMIFANTLDDVREHLLMWQELPTVRPGGGRVHRPSTKLWCPKCKRIIYASRKTQEVGDIICEPCGVHFVGSDDEPF